MKKVILGLALIVALRAYAQQPIIWSDDMALDPDVAVTLSSLLKMQDQGAVKILGIVADSANVDSAPVAHILTSYYQRSAVSVSANQTSNPACGNGCNGSGFGASTVSKFAAGDTRTNYPNCISQLRTILARFSGSNIHMVETGFPTCIVALMQSPADGISPLTGEQLIQAKVSELDIMGGYWPVTGSGEFNFQSDPADQSYIATNWTSQNGYPPLYYTGFQAGTSTDAGFPTFANTNINPGAYILSVGGYGLQRPLWDALAVLHAAFGTTYRGTTTFTVTGPGTATVNSSTGANTWSTSTNSGQYYLSNAAAATFLSDIFDGYSYAWGYCALPVYASTGGMAAGGATASGGASIH